MSWRREAVNKPGDRRRRRTFWLAWGAAGCAAVLAVVLSATLSGGGHATLTALPIDTPTPQVTVTDATPEPTPTPTPQPSESSVPAVGSPPTAAPAANVVTLSLVGSPSSGQEGMLRVHVATADTWTAYVLSFNGNDLHFPRLFWAANQPNGGDIDEQQLFDVCKTHADLTRPTDQTKSFPFTPLAAGHFHTVVQVLHGTCSTESPGWAEFTLAGPHVITTTVDFTVADSGWHFDANGPEAPFGAISFERHTYDPNGPFLLPGGSATPGFEFSAGDPDGPTPGVTVDWGDGTAPEDISAMSVPGCYGEGVSGSMVYLPSYCIYQPDHAYAHSGRYTITLNLHGGEGTRNPQTASVRAEWVVGDPSPTPTPS